MTLPVSGGQAKQNFEDIWNAIANLKSYCLIVQTNTAGGAATSAEAILQVALNAQIYVKMHDALAANSTLTTSVVTYAQTQVPGVTFTAADFVAVRNAANAMFNAIISQYPHDAQNHLLDRTFNVDTGLTWTIVTAAQMPTIMAAIATFLATLS